MAVNLEDILLLKAQQDAANRGDNTLGSLVGGAAGGSIGLVAGQLAHDAGKNALLQRLADRTQIPNAPLKPGALNAVRPGGRMAGGLVGLITGGALGAGVQALATRESPAARLLAKIQTQGELSPAEAEELESVLTDTYNNIVG